MRLLVTGTGGLIGSNLAAAAVQQSWSVLGTWRLTPVSVIGARTVALDVADHRACAALAEEFEPDVVVHTAAFSAPGLLERDPRLAELSLLGTESTLAAARAVRAHYVLVSCDDVFSGQRPTGECWEEHDPAEPVNAHGRSLLACEQLTQDAPGSWLITRPAEVYGVNLSIPAPSRGPTAAREGSPGLLARHVWERSGMPLRLVARLRAGLALPAPAGLRRSPTYAWDYAQRLCDLIAQEGEGIYNTAGPTILGRLAHLRLLARAFGCDLQLVRDGSPAAHLQACGEPTELPLPANTALCDHKASFTLGRPAIDPFAGHRLMRRQLEQVLHTTDPPSSPLTPPPLPAPPISVEALG